MKSRTLNGSKKSKRGRRGRRSWGKDSLRNRPCTTIVKIARGTSTARSAVLYKSKALNL
jgi:hypothetical protein